MKIEQHITGLLYSNMYVISENGHAIVIDPCVNTDPAKGLQFDWILLTHEHYDHISGVNAWKKTTDADVLCSKMCAERTKDPRKNQARFFPEFCELQTWVALDEIPSTDRDYGCYADKTFQNRISFVWQGHELDLMEIPGHSPGSIGIYIDRRIFFSGDSLLENKNIELRFPGGSRQQWIKTGLPRINAVPKGTVVYPGHFRPFILN